MNEWKDGSLINAATLKELTPEQLQKLAEILEKI